METTQSSKNTSIFTLRRSATKTSFRKSTSSGITRKNQIKPLSSKANISGKSPSTSSRPPSTQWTIATEFLAKVQPSYSTLLTTTSLSIATPSKIPSPATTRAQWSIWVLSPPTKSEGTPSTLTPKRQSSFTRVTPQHCTTLLLSLELPSFPGTSCKFTT